MADVTIDIVAKDNFTGVLGNFGNIMTGIASIVDLAGDAWRAFSGVALEGLEAIGQYERLTATMETLVAKEILAADGAETMAEALAMSGDKAEELLVWVQQLAIESPFSQEGVADAFRTALAYGFTADEAQRLTEAMIDFASGSGATEGAMGQIALALGQIQAKGKLAGQEVLQLVNAGLPVNDILADAFDVTTAEIVEMREKGLIPAQEAIEAITSYLETNFAGAAQRQAETWTGLKNTFLDIKEIGLREFFGGLADAIKPVVVELSNWLQGPGLEQLAAWGDALGELVTKLVDFGLEFSDIFEGVFSGEVGIGEFIAQSIEDTDWESLVLSIDASLGRAIDSVNWRETGLALNEAIKKAIKQAISGENIGSYFKDEFGRIDWVMVFAPAIANLGKVMETEFGRSAKEAIQGFVDGLLGGPSNRTWLDVIRDAFFPIISIVKTLFGISSPSTVFMQIGRDLISGLIFGIGSMIAPMLSFLGTLVDLLLLPFQPLLDIIGALTGSGDVIGTGDVIDWGNGSGTPSTGASTVTNNYYFYGTVNMSGVGPEGTYDCPSPNPLINATSGTLSTQGFAP